MATLKRGLPAQKPGAIIKELYMLPLGLTAHDLAKNINVHYTTLSYMLNGRTRISLEMAVKLAAAFGTEPEIFLNLQRDYDLWYIDKKQLIKGIRTYKLTG